MSQLKAKTDIPPGYVRTAVKRAIKDDRLNKTARAAFAKSIAAADDATLLAGLDEFRDATTNYAKEVFAMMDAERERRGLK